ncbi:hypothetical protein [Halarchaeum nitratireducens]|uniref:hypothetical protein n=1 Tax=Halarchaeum nitratireducens TaxID=489913 RepID=UPI001E368527|nr:hypothetical protein [Halarchaeum nitratireducens]
MDASEAGSVFLLDETALTVAGARAVAPTPEEATTLSRGDPDSDLPLTDADERACTVALTSIEEHIRTAIGNTLRIATRVEQTQHPGEPRLRRIRAFAQSAPSRHSSPYASSRGILLEMDADYERERAEMEAL